MDYDVIVIGSGFGGAITSCRLAERGYKVLVLERGRRWTKGTFPRAPDDAWVWDSERPEECNGWLELRRFRNMAVAAGAAVGGGSLIYANISCEAHPERFKSGWPEEISYAELKPHYDRVAAFMDVQSVPDNQWTERMKLMKLGAERIGAGRKFRKLELAVSFDKEWTYDRERGEGASTTFTNQHGAEQGTCVHLGNCDIGCDVLAKNTLDLNYLYVAENKYHADVRELSLVSTIEPIEHGYRVHFENLANGRAKGAHTARLVLVAAGSMGSTELLLRCKQETKTLPKLSPFLGRSWSSNGDFLTPALYPAQHINPEHGPTIASAIDLFDPAVDGGFWIEDGGFPNLLANYVDRKSENPRVGFQARMLLQFIQGFLRREGGTRHVMPWFAQGVDGADGTLTLKARSFWDRRLRLDLDWDIARSKQLIDRIVDTHARLSAETGGLPLVPPTWTLFRDLITPHPLGGCNMGRDSDVGVVNHKGEVYGYPGLYVVDGAIIPEALGVNPSRTIGALAERIASIMIAEGQ